MWWLDLAAPVRPLPEFARWLDDEESAHARRFHFDIHRRRHIAAHGQMRAVLASYAGVAPPELRFAREARGKPYLVHPSPADGTVHFNLSHSDDQALLAVARVAALGADIEVKRPMSDLEALARSHFGAAELEEWRILPASLQLDGFLAAWTRKEAYVKALGAGLAVPLDSFEVALHPDRPAELRSIAGSEAAARNWSLWSARPTQTSWAALAVRMAGAVVRTFSLRDIHAA